METSIEARLERLERRNRILGATALAALGALVLGAFAGPQEEEAAAVPETLRAHRIELVDGEDRVRAEIAIDANGSAGLFVRDARGKLRASVAHGDAQTALYLRDASETIRVGAAQFAHGGGGFALHGEESRGAAALYLAEGTGTLTFYDPDGGITARLPE